MKHAIITGGSSGIGKAIAAVLLQRGWTVSIIARNAQRLLQAVTELQTSCTSPQQVVQAYAADVGDFAQINQAIQTAIEAQGTPDLLITSAAIGSPGYFEQLPVEDFASSMQANYLGTVYAIKSVLATMQDKKQGQIMIISSFGAVAPMFGYGSYAPTKLALKGLAESLRAELKWDNITVSICYPGYTSTPMLERESFLDRPLETRMLGGSAKSTPEYVAQRIVQGIEKKSSVVVPARAQVLFYFLFNPFAALWEKYTDFIVARARKIRFYYSNK